MVHLLDGDEDGKMDGGQQLDAAIDGGGWMVCGPAGGVDERLVIECCGVEFAAALLGR